MVSSFQTVIIYAAITVDLQRLIHKRIHARRKVVTAITSSPPEDPKHR